MSSNQKLEFQELMKGEVSRTYFCPNGELEVTGVLRISVSHRLETADGENCSVPAG